MMDDTRLAVAALLGETAQAHHQAYAATDGFDPEWPWWYAERLVDPLRDLGVAVTKSRIVFVLVGAERDLPEVGEGWPEAYAARLIAEGR